MARIGDRPSRLATSGYFGEERAIGRARLAERESEMSQITSWREELFARGPGLDAVREAYDGAGLFHVEMFVGLPGKREELVTQRRMENQYYTNIRERGSAIFVRLAGAEFDFLPSASTRT